MQITDSFEDFLRVRCYKVHGLSISIILIWNFQQCLTYIQALFHTTALKVHKTEIFLALILKFVLFLC
jgi:hypothetical protein